ncbi:MAG: MotA/TolQ/ExbB proton channel family protein [Planctomycetaceae bacterium]|nr:MotA/TolQ/ExbB proton channel family protein [Planctomycetaceae bacterium]
MDIASIIGLIVGTVMILGSIIMGGGTIGGFTDYPSIVLVAGGTICTILIAYPMSEVIKIMGVTKNAFLTKQKDVLAIINQLVSLSESARRDGLLALEGRIEEIDDAFLIMGIRMAVDGMSPEIVDAIMRTEMDAVEGRHEIGKSFYDALAKYAPAFGMIGTLIGLVLMLADMNPDTIGSGMAVALLTTLYGAVAANFVFLPIADKLAYYSSRELLTMEIMVRGVIAIQAGENPRVIKQKLMTFIPPKSRPEEEESV